MGRLVAAATELATSLAAATFSMPITVGREYLADKAIESLGGVYVQVSPDGQERERVGRGLMQADSRVKVGVQAKVDATDEAAVDALVDLVEEIAAHMEGTQLGTAGQAHIVEFVTLLDHERLDTKSIFIARLDGTYRNH